MHKNCQKSAVLRYFKTLDPKIVCKYENDERTKCNFLQKSSYKQKIAHNLNETEENAQKPGPGIQRR